MNFKTTYILFGVLLLLLGIFGLAQFIGLRSPTDKSIYVLPSLNDRKSPIRNSDIETVEIDRARPNGEKLVFFRTDSGWQLKQPSVRVEGYLVDRLIDQVIKARVEEKADVSDSPAQFGLDTPAAKVTLTKKGGDKEYRLNLGNDSPGGESAVTYVTSSDRKKPTAVKRGELDMLTKAVNDFRSKNLLEASSLNAQSVSLQEGGKDAIALEKGSDSRWRFTKPAFGEAEFEPPAAPPGAPPPPEPKVIAAVKELLDALGQIRVEDTADFVAEDVSDADLGAKYGLDAAKPTTLRVEVVRNPGGMLGGDEKKEPTKEILLIGKKVETKGDKKTDKYYARLESDKAVVQVPSRLVDPLVKVAQAPEILRNRDLMQVDTAKVDAIDITNPSASLRLRRGLGEAWKLFTGSPPPRDADQRAVSDLLAFLNTKRQIRGFPEAAKKDEELGLDKPTAQLALWVDGVQPEEKKDEKPDDKPAEKKDEKKDERKDQKDVKPADKKDEKKDQKDVKPADKKDPNAEPKLKTDKPTVRLAFGKKDGDGVWVRREVGDEKLRALVPEAILTRVLEGPLAYLDRSLPTFPAEAELVKLTVARGGETFEIEREKKDDKGPATWRIAQPKTVAGRSADNITVENILANVRNLQADKLVSEKATDADLERYGLKTPAFKATVTLKLKDGKTEDRTVLFGKETEDKTGRYAKLGERDIVFLVRPTAAVALQGELLDPTVLSFELDKVRGLKLHGWHNVVGTPYMLDLERKSAGSWSVKAPAGFQLNEIATESFLASLRGLRALRFVGQKTGAKPEHKLDVKDGALEIDITLEGEKDPLRLTVGALSAADKAYFATTSKLPGDVFLVPEDRFKKALEAPIYFRK